MFLKKFLFTFASVQNVDEPTFFLLFPKSVVNILITNPTYKCLDRLIPNKKGPFKGMTDF